MSHEMLTDVFGLGSFDEAVFCGIAATEFDDSSRHVFCKPMTRKHWKPLRVFDIVQFQFFEAAGKQLLENY